MFFFLLLFCTDPLDFISNAGRVKSVNKSIYLKHKDEDVKSNTVHWQQWDELLCPIPSFHLSLPIFKTAVIWLCEFCIVYSDWWGWKYTPPQWENQSPFTLLTTPRTRLCCCSHCSPLMNQSNVCQHCVKQWNDDQWWHFRILVQRYISEDQYRFLFWDSCHVWRWVQDIPRLSPNVCQVRLKHTSTVMRKSRSVLVCFPVSSCPCLPSLLLPYFSPPVLRQPARQLWLPHSSLPRCFAPLFSLHAPHPPTCYLFKNDCTSWLYPAMRFHTSALQCHFVPSRKTFTLHAYLNGKCDAEETDVSKSSWLHGILRKLRIWKAMFETDLEVV